jgi:2,4-dienoyl-CoA reductase-like NADH-dependent reductase (Old Yellow Enzyme family)/thioredoxin reductase
VEGLPIRGQTDTVEGRQSMTTIFPRLFERGKIGRLEIGNRVVKAATYGALSNPDGSVTDRMIRFYEKVARGGTGLVIVESAWIDKKGSKAAPCSLGVADVEHIPGLASLARAICDSGAKAALQIAHFGRDNFLGITPAKSASRIPMSALGTVAFETFGAEPVPEELTVEEIREVVAAFGDAAKRAQTAGFDLVEVHGAHGTLVTNFLSPATNRRTDMYGGSLQNRMRFLVEVVRAIKGKTGGDFPLSIRLSGIDYEPNGVVIEDTLEVVKVIEKIGVDVIHVSGGSHIQGIHCASPMSMPLGHHVREAEAVKKVVHIPVIVSGSITTPQLAEEILESGKADFIALARPLFADPNWPQKAREGRPEDIIPCIRCNEGCQYRSNRKYRPILCTVNVAMGRDDTFIITAAERQKDVAVIGGGPGGMEAARVCALRGHRVTLYEKRNLGGVLIEASVPEFKSDLRRLVSYYVTQMEKLKVKVIQEEATVDTVKDGKFDVVIVAVGGTPLTLDVPGIDRPIVINAQGALSGKLSVGQRVLVVGGGMVGTAVGLWLAEQGKEVIFVEMLDDFMVGVGIRDRVAYQERLAKQKVTIYTGKRLESVIEKGAVVVDKKGSRQEILADSIVVAAGFAPQASLREQLEKEKHLEVYAVGDCVNPGMIFDAIHEGYLTARGI